MRARAVLVLLLLLIVAGGCGGSDEPERELVVGARVRIGVVAGETEVFRGVRVAANRIDNAGGIGGALTIVPVAGAARDLLRDGVRLFVLPCREGVVEAATLVERSRAIAVAPCDDGELGRTLRRVFVTGLSPRAQADALADYAADGAHLVPPQTERGRRVARLLRIGSGGSALVSPDAPETVAPPPGVPEGTVFATYGFPDPGSRADEFYERYRAVFGSRPASVVAALAADALDALADAVELAQSTRPLHVAEAFVEGFEVRGALGTIRFDHGSRRAEVDATLVRVHDGKLRTVAR